MKRITKLISIDSSSTKTGWAIFENGKLKDYGIIDLHNNKDSYLRLKEMVYNIWQLLEYNKPNIIVIEKLNVGRNMQATRLLSKIIGSIYCYSILHDDVFYFEIQASEWRSKLGMQSSGRKRNDYKKLSVSYVKDLYQIEVSDDISDAICAGLGYIKMFS